jgi:dethiobiotin synthetase
LAQTIFITGIGTGIGKTVVSAILMNALQADYWKPVQAGFDSGTDSEWMRSMVSNQQSKIHEEVYRLKHAASPHIAAKEEGVKIDIDYIVSQMPDVHRPLIIEGAGGLMVPLNEEEFVIDLIKKLSTKVILVSRNYLGSINHSLLTAQACKQKKLDVLGWVFTDEYLNYEEQVVRWSGYQKLFSVPKLAVINKNNIASEALRIKEYLLPFLS